MSAAPEPLAAILAEMRDRAMMRSAVGFRTEPQKLREYADRIEAAAERERQMTESCVRADCAIISQNAQERLVREAERRHAEQMNAVAAPGNAAALREALASIAAIAADAFGGPERHREASQSHALSLIEGAARAAAAAPARNCDRYHTKEEAWRAFKTEDAHFNDPSFLDWLFATEEGGEE